jgi:hypothetical protein
VSDWEPITRAERGYVTGSLLFSQELRAAADAWSRPINPGVATAPNRGAGAPRRAGPITERG